MGLLKRRGLYTDAEVAGRTDGGFVVPIVVELDLTVDGFFVGPVVVALGFARLVAGREVVLELGTETAAEVAGRRMNFEDEDTIPVLVAAEAAVPGREGGALPLTARLAGPVVTFLKLEVDATDGALELIARGSAVVGLGFKRVAAVAEAIGFCCFR